MGKKKLLIIQVVPSGFGGIQSYAKSLKKNLNKEQIKVINLETYTVNYKGNILINSFLKIIKIIQNSFKLRNHIIKYKNDYKIILHNHVAMKISFWENSWYSFIGKLSMIPYIFHIHSSLFCIEYEKSNFIEKKVRDIILKHCSKVVALSNYWKKKFLKINCLNKKKIITINNFIDDSIFKNISKQEARKILKIPFNKKIILSFGRFVEIKGFQFLLDSIPDIVAKRKDIIFFIGGQGKMYNYYIKKIKENSISDFANLIGYIPNEKSYLWFHASDIFVLPSLRETFPISIIEAMASGTPVIGSRVGAIPEIINSEEFGLITEPGNSKDLTEKISIALNKKWNEKDIIENTKKYTWYNIKKDILKLYQDIIKNT